MSFFNKYNILNENQFGFRKGFSTTLAITEFYEQALMSLDKKQAVCAILIDLSKAFDSVSRKIVLFKLYRYGIRGNSYNLIQSYLQNRVQYVSCESISSEKVSVEVGVPQGSILGPLLFLVLINDLKTCTELNIINYADDTLLYHSFYNCNNIQFFVNKELVKVKTWLGKNHLKLNIGKTKLMFLNKKLDKFKSIGNIKITLDGTQKLEIVEHCKYLGIILDNELKWKSHIEHLNQRLSNVLRMLYRIRYYLPKTALLAISHSLFLSHINYGILCWGRAGKTTIDPITIMLNKLIKCINFKPYRYSNVNPLFYKDKILQANDIFKFELGKFLYKFNNNQLPAIFHNYFENLTNIHDYNTRGKKDNFYLERANSNMGLNTLKYMGVNLWRTIELSTKRSKSYALFSSNYRNDLLRQYETK
jgi:hypothetical protein